MTEAEKYPDQKSSALLMHFAPAWAGFTSAADRARLDAYCNQETRTITEHVIVDGDFQLAD